MADEECVEGSGDEEMEIYDNDEGDGDSDGGIEVDDENDEETMLPGKEESSSEKKKSKDKMKKKEEKKEVFLPGDEMEEGDELTYDKSAYEMYHAAQTNAPCLSFDVIPDNLGDSRTEFPMTAYIVAGTQAAPGKQNHVIVMKMSQLDKTISNDEDSDSDDELLDEEPDLDTAMLNHSGGVNRIRYSSIPERHIVASWSERGQVHIWDISQQVISVDNPATLAGPSHAKDFKPLFSFDGHQTEGFAMDWSSTVRGR